jgi:hypothetical protein
MKIDLTRKEVKRLIQALLLASDYQESSIDAYRIEPIYRGGRVVSVFPKDKEIRLIISQWNRDIKTFLRIKDKLRMNLVKE